MCKIKIMIDLLIRKPVEKSIKKETIVISKGADKPLKSALKAISWRIVGTIDTMIISFIITGKIHLAVSIGGIEVLSKTVLYYFHERLWARIHSFKLKRWTVRIRQEVWN